MTWEHSIDLRADITEALKRTHGYQRISYSRHEMLCNFFFLSVLVHQISISDLLTVYRRE